jgi:hypothetical protein
MRLGGDPGMLSPCPEKPKGMHWHTYGRLQQRARGAEMMAEHLWAVLGRIQDAPGQMAEHGTWPLCQTTTVEGLLVMSNSSVETMPPSAETNGYERSRLNATRHGILSRHRVLPWEDRSEYDDLWESLVAEHAPSGPTEHHLVEELAGLMWRKQRLVVAETAAYRAGLHRALGEGAWDEDRGW